jgi:hypothetical protein
VTEHSDPAIYVDEDDYEITLRESRSLYDEVDAAFRAGRLLEGERERWMKAMDELGRRIIEMERIPIVPQSPVSNRPAAPAAPTGKASL